MTLLGQIDLPEPKTTKLDKSSVAWLLLAGVLSATGAYMLGLWLCPDINPFWGMMLFASVWTFITVVIVVADKFNEARICCSEEPVCQRCGSPLDDDGHCEDETCLFSTCDQDNPLGWAGHPDVNLNPLTRQG